jgi:hypothetical protein
MSLTSYRAAPPRVGDRWRLIRATDHWLLIHVPGLEPGELIAADEVGGPGGDLLSRGLGHSTMGAGGFHGRVRDGIGCAPPAKTTRSSSLVSDQFPGSSPGHGSVASDQTAGSGARCALC